VRVEGRTGLSNRFMPAIIPSIKRRPVPWGVGAVDTAEIEGKDRLVQAAGGLKVGLFSSILKTNVADMKEKRDVEGLMHASKNRGSVWVRRDAVLALGEIGDLQSVDVLAEALRDKNELVRNAAAEAFGMMGGHPKAVEFLLGSLKDGNSAVREEAASALGKVGHETAVDPLIEALKDESFFVRQSAAVSLGKIGQSRAVDPLTEVLKDEDKDVRQATVAALGDIGDARSVEPLIETLKDESARVRYMAVEALDKIGDARAVAPLIEALKDRGWLELASGDGKTGKAKASEKVWVRQRAVEALARLGDPRAAEPINEMLSDKHESIRLAAQEALEKLKGQSPSV